jgi:hypothetical protein
MHRYPANHAAKRAQRRKSRRSRFWGGLISAGIFAGLIWMAAAGISFVGGKFQSVEGGEHAVAKNGTGQIVKVGSDNCSKIDFNNLNGHFGDQRYIPCPEGRHINREYQLPSNRIESFSRSFSK